MYLLFDIVPDTAATAPGRGLVQVAVLIFSSLGFLVLGRHRTKPLPWGSLGIVADEIGVKVLLHVLDSVVELLADHDLEVLIEQGAVTLDEAVPDVWWRTR